jgi:hypothetical protein
VHLDWDTLSVVPHSDVPLLTIYRDINLVHGLVSLVVVTGVN